MLFVNAIFLSSISTRLNPLLLKCDFDTVASPPPPPQTYHWQSQKQGISLHNRGQLKILSLEMNVDEALIPRILQKLKILKVILF